MKRHGWIVAALAYANPSYRELVARSIRFVTGK